jgi:hypothetical protein
MDREENIFLSEIAIQKILESGVSEKDILQHLEIFRKGLPFIRLYKSCKVGDGIVAIKEVEFDSLIQLHEDAALQGRILKFVPASGAATRMFQKLHSYLSNDWTAEELYKKHDGGDKTASAVVAIIECLKTLAFYPALKNQLAKDGFDIERLVENKEFRTIISYILTDCGLNYANLPKGMICFHRAQTGGRTAFEEHLLEALNYAKDSNNISHVHFTLSPEYQEEFDKLLRDVRKLYEVDGQKLSISYSYQKSSTNTIAVTKENEAYLDGNNNFVFRPAGHGALLENLNDLKADLVFIKNIDNVVPDRLKETTCLYKKLICGLLVKLELHTHDCLRKLGSNTVSEKELSEIEVFVQEELLISLPENFHNFSRSQRIQFLFSKLNRPMRICGMVRNQGQVGGGPFWVKEANGEITVQIVESSQIDKSDNSQKEIFESATHFNPVDLICSVRDYKGKSFDLLNYRNPDTGFITVKSKDGVEIKALELPGLWNGSMADWITVFVEVPKITFNPVKEINDLLLPEHQE